MADSATFWNKIAEKYAANPIKDIPAYEKTLERVRSYLSAKDSVLEVGCGTGTTALLLADGVHDYTATDISSGMIDVARRKHAKQTAINLTFETASTAEALRDRKFDVILGFNLLHLLEDTEESINAMRNALKPGGYLITKTPGLKGRGFHIRLVIALMRMVGKAPFVAFHGPEDIERMMVDAGFEIVETGDYPAKPPNHFVVARRV